jgi:long-chain acyl-CoA synthetase
MRQSVDPAHEAFQYTVRPVNAIVEHWDRWWVRDPGRRLVHVPAANRTLTARDIDAARRRYESALASANIADGQLIVSAIGNHAGLASMLLAAWNVGAVVMPVDIDTPAAELRDVVERFSACALVRTRRASSSGGDDAADTWQDIRLDGQLRLSVCKGRTWTRYPDAALLKLTSGSTGLPKAVRATDMTLISDTRHIVSAMGIGPDDIQLAAIPLSHAYGFGNLLIPVLLQGTAVVLRESFVPQQVVSDARRYGARVLQGVPFMFQYFATHPPPGGWPEPLTLLVSAGATLEPETVKTFYDRFGVKIHSFYGTSEAGGIAFDASDDVDGVATVGWPIPGVAVELRPANTIPAGEGRVYVRGDGVASGYVADPSDGSDLGNGGFLTGDYGHLLPDGRLVLTGRVSAFINVAGRKVQPEEVERVLRDMPGVKDVRVLAAVDAARGEQIAAVIAGDPTLTLTAVRRYCAKRLTAHKIPRAVVVVGDIPVTLRGKTDHRALRALVDAHFTRTV